MIGIILVESEQLMSPFWIKPLLKRPTIPNIGGNSGLLWRNSPRIHNRKPHNWKLKINMTKPLFCVFNSNSSNFVSAQSFSCPIFFLGEKATKMGWFQQKRVFPPRFFWLRGAVSGPIFFGNSSRLPFKACLQ